jgi:hypothetical protein
MQILYFSSSFVCEIESFDASHNKSLFFKKNIHLFISCHIYQQTSFKMAASVGMVYLNSSKNNSIKLATGIIAASAILMYITKPKIFYNKRGQNKPFGTGEEETLLPPWMAMTGLGLAAYVASNIIESLQ